MAVDPPASTGTPAATGTPVDGQTLTADPGTWTGTGPIDFTYQWQRCDADGADCADVPGATDPTYTLGTDDLGSTVRVVVTGDNGETTSIPSDAVGPVAPLAPAATSVPTITGTVGAGHTLTAGDGTWDGSRAAHLHLPVAALRQRRRQLRRHRRRRRTRPTTSWTPTSATTIRVAVTATNAAGDDTAVSAPTAPTLPAPPANATPPAARPARQSTAAR